MDEDITVQYPIEAPASKVMVFVGKGFQCNIGQDTEEQNHPEITIGLNLQSMHTLGMEVIKIGWERKETEAASTRLTNVESNVQTSAM